MNWSPRDYDRLERAITERRRIQLVRGGSEITLMPDRLRVEYGEEVLVARHPNTGDRLELPLVEIDRFDVV